MGRVSKKIKNIFIQTQPSSRFLPMFFINTVFASHPLIQVSLGKCSLLAVI